MKNDRKSLIRKNPSGTNKQWIMALLIVFLLISGTGLALGGGYVRRQLLKSNEATAMDLAMFVENNFHLTDAENTYMKSLTFNEMEVDPINQRLMDTGEGVKLNAEVSNVYLLAPLTEQEIKYTIPDDLSEFFGAPAGTPMDGVWLLNGKIDENGHFLPAEREDIYRYTVLTESQKAAMKAGHAVSDYSEDAWGSFITGYAPLYTEEGSFAGLIGIDMDPDKFQRSAQTMVLLMLLVFFVTLLIAATLFLVFYIKYWKIRSEESLEREAHYEQMIRSMSEMDDENLIAKGRHNLTKNCVGFYSGKRSGALDLKEGTCYEDAVEHLAASAVSESKGEEIRRRLNREHLLKQFQAGETEGVVEYQRIMPEDEISWVSTKYALFAEPETNDVMLFLYSYDVTLQVLDEQVVNRLSSMDYDGVGLVNVKSRQYILKTMLNKIEGPAVRGSGDFEERARERLSVLLPESEREEIMRQFRIDYIVEQLKKKPFFPILYSIKKAPGVVARKKCQFCYLDESQSVILYCRSDVTELYEKEQAHIQQMEQALKAAQAGNQAKSDFLSRMSHDMRTPLNGILGLTALLQESVTEQTASRDLAQLELSGRYLLNLVNDTLDVSRIESGKLELKPIICDGRTAFDNVIALIGPSIQEKKQQFFVHTEEAVFRTVFMDVGRVEQILMNLLGNAVKFTPEAGRIDLTVRTVEESKEQILDKMVVEDTGIGMEQSFLPHLFEPFSQADTTRTSTYQGTGLGMTITKEILDIMGGDIQVESEPGKGTRFTVTLPIKLASEEQIRSWKKEEPVEAKDKSLEGCRVLLCEDHPLNAAIATRLLRAKGVLVELAENGQIGVDMLAGSEIGYYDAVLMDIRMPVMDGLDAARAIRALSREDADRIPIIAMTANAFDEDVEKTRAAGMDAHLSKPIDPQLLYQTLSRFV